MSSQPSVGAQPGPTDALPDVSQGEANLPKRSVVEVGKVSSIERVNPGALIGRLDTGTVERILDGMGFLQRAGFTR